MLYYYYCKSNLYSAFLNTQRRFTRGQETVTNRTKQRNGKTKQTEQTNKILVTERKESSLEKLYGSHGRHGLAVSR